MLWSIAQIVVTDFLRTRFFVRNVAIKRWKLLKGISQVLQMKLKKHTKMSQELEKAFSEAAKEISTAFQTASENIQKSLTREQIVCSNCGIENPSNAVFCYNCGKKVRVK